MSYQSSWRVALCAAFISLGVSRSASATPETRKLRARIVSTDATHFEIDLDVLAQVMLVGLSQPIDIRMTGRGPQFKRIAPGSLLARLGMASNDIVVRLAGVPVRSTSALPSIYAKMKMDRKFTLELERNSQPLTLHYRITGRISARAPRRALSPRLAGKLIEGITQKSEHHYVIRRALFKELMDDPEQLARQARIVPHFQNGAQDGFKLYGIRRSSVFSRLGFKNGDRIASVNNQSLKTVSQATEVFERLKRAQRLEFQLQRRGQPLELVVELK